MINNSYEQKSVFVQTPVDAPCIFNQIYLNSERTEFFIEKQL